MKSGKKPGNFLTEHNELHLKAIEAAEKAKDLPHLKNKPVKFDINRKP